MENAVWSSNLSEAPRDTAIIVVTEHGFAFTVRWDEKYNGCYLVMSDDRDIYIMPRYITFWTTVPQKTT